MTHRDPTGTAHDPRPARTAREARDEPAATIAPLAERLLTLVLRHRDVVRADVLLERFARDLGEALGARSALRRAGGDADGATAATLRVRVEGEVVALLDLVREAPFDAEEQRLLIHVLRQLDDRLAQLADGAEAHLQADLVHALATAEGLEDGAARALEVVLRHSGASGGALLRTEGDRFEPLADAGAWTGDDTSARAAARACGEGDDPLAERGRLVACRLGTGRPHRFVLLLRFADDGVQGLRWPALRRVGRTLALHLETLWRERVHDRLLEFHAGSWEQPPEELYERLLDAAIDLVHGADSGSLLVRRAREEPFVFQAVRGFDVDALHGATVAMDEMRAWYGRDDGEWRRGRSRIVRSTEADIAALSRATSPQIEVEGTGTERIRATICLPVPHEGEVMAVLNLDNQRDADAFGRDSLRVVDRFGPPLAGILHRQHTKDLLHKAALTDALTGLDNRRPFATALQRELARHARTGAPVSVLVMDLTGFKTINDEAGHDAGDEALVLVARALRENVRETDVLARRGGDEFAAILVDAAAREAAEAAARLRDAVGRIEIGGHRLRINVGAASAPEDGTLEEELLRLADRRMYASKRAARAPGR